MYIYICLYPLETIKELTLTQKVKAYTAHGFTPVDSLTDDFSKGYKVQVSPYHPIVWGANFFLWFNCGQPSQEMSCVFQEL